ncbi:hypothetical protein HPB50_022515 [Hyalomma asiaticum]|uniref:Uncharacterized protein n=1 Tax=Hyalomma asiaticum TaxID=266040 RepID=A0ACB7S342_HYAAI|nr:hypothetical protein HPB50_022515 [Hyalomma asiaticum]
MDSTCGHRSVRLSFSRALKEQSLITVMVRKTKIVGVATLAVLMLALLGSTNAQACDPVACYGRCIGDGATYVRNVSTVVTEVERSLFGSSVPKTHNWFLCVEMAGNMSLLSLLYSSLSPSRSPESWPVWLVQCVSLQGGLYCAQMLLSAALSDSTYFLLHATFYFLLFQMTSTLFVLGSGIYLLTSYVNKFAGAVAMATGAIHATHLCFTVNEHYFKSRGY